ncbi:MAG: hypothetical protein LBP28_09050 [Coriobacteriales bacterium]|nr:hypothetical protein [Coriobacteriales bacterium]
MATESFSRILHLNDEQFEQVVRAMECVNANPPAPRKSGIRWGDTEQIMRALEQKYSVDKHS